METTERKLILMRHGEAEASLSGDFYRKLTSNGQEQAKNVGIKLKNKGYFPDVIVCSTAVRTMMTARNVATELGYPLDHIVEAPEIYEANTRTILEIINATEDSIHTLMLIGHNPTFSQMIAYLTQEHIKPLSPASFAVLQFRADRWAYVSMGNADLLAMTDESKTAF